jgi:iron complex outermembrane receptor protein
MASRRVQFSAGSALASRPGGWARVAALLLAVALPSAVAAEPAVLAQAETPTEEPGSAPGESPADAPAPEPAPSRSPPPPSGVEVIRIKGRPLSAIETEVPESATQFDASAIQALGAQNVADLAKVTPNVEIRSAGSTQATFFVRGVGLSDFSSNAAGAVAIYQDDVAINAPAMQVGQLFDVENVEVLRGPVGTGSGYNASAGAIKIYSRKPTGEYAASMRSSFGTYLSDDAVNGALSQDYEGAIEVPLVDEMLATRLAFRYQVADPFMKNGCGNAPPLDERLRVGDRIPNPNPPPATIRVTASMAAVCSEGLIQNGQRSPIEVGLPPLVGDQGQWAARGSTRFQPPGSDMDWLLVLHGARTDQLSTLGQAIGTGNGVLGAATIRNYTEPDSVREFNTLFDEGIAMGLTAGQASNRANEIRAKNLAETRPLDLGPYRGDYNRVGRTTFDTWGASLRGDVPIGPVNLTTISGYDTYERFRDTDNDFTPDVLFETVIEDDAWQFFQELRVGGELEDTPLRWNTGGFYLMEELASRTDLEAFDPLFEVDRIFYQDLWSFAVYGEFGWDFLDDFTLEGGVRYNWTRKNFDYETRNPVFQSHAVQEETWSAPTGQLVLTYRFTEGVNAYWKYTRGWKPGHYNATATDAADNPPAKPEVIDSFETGLRGAWLDGRLSAGTALFYYKYVDYQVFVFENNPGGAPVLEIINANDAEVYGAEVELRGEPFSGWAPELLEGLVLTGRFGWLESQFLDFTNQVFRTDPSFPFPIVASVDDYSGNPLINSPKFKLSGAAEWTFDLGRWGAVIPRYDFAWSDDIFFDPTDGVGSGVTPLPELTIGQPAFWLHNLRLGYRTPEGNVEIGVWVRNLEDTRYKTYGFDASKFSRVIINFVGPPRTVGLDFSVNF